MSESACPFGGFTGLTDFQDNPAFVLNRMDTMLRDRQDDPAFVLNRMRKKKKDGKDNPIY